MFDTFTVQLGKFLYFQDIETIFTGFDTRNVGLRTLHFLGNINLPESSLVPRFDHPFDENGVFFCADCSSHILQTYIREIKKKQSLVRLLVPSCGDDRARTGDLLRDRQTL